MMRCSERDLLACPFDVFLNQSEDHVLLVAIS
jgi:hypothetical protein